MTSRAIVGWCLAFCVVFLSSIQNASGQSARPEEVKFPSGNLLLYGSLYRPQGNGAFPAILYNPGSEHNPGLKAALGEFFSSRGYVFFLPDRRGHGRSPDDSFVESLYAQGVAGRIALHETHLEDQLAALAYLKQLSDVDPQRIAVAGCSYGGIQTVLAVEANAEQKLGLRAAIDFAGGAMSWRSLSLRDRMVRAIRKLPFLFSSFRRRTITISVRAGLLPGSLSN